MGSKPRIYLDSCCFIDVVKQAVGVLPTQRDSSVWFIKKIFEAHRAGILTAHTSIVAVGECVAIEKGQADVPIDAQERFRALLTSGQYVQLLNPTPATQLLVQKFRWDHGLVLGAIDALHFASALERGCAEFITTDDRLKKPKIANAIPILAKLGMRLIEAPSTTCLPDEFRQMNILSPN